MNELLESDRVKYIGMCFSFSNVLDIAIYYCHRHTKLCFQSSTKTAQNNGSQTQEMLGANRGTSKTVTFLVCMIIKAKDANASCFTDLGTVPGFWL